MRFLFFQYFNQDDATFLPRSGCATESILHTCSFLYGEPPPQGVPASQRCLPRRRRGRTTSRLLTPGKEDTPGKGLVVVPVESIVAYVKDREPLARAGGGEHVFQLGFAEAVPGDGVGCFVGCVSGGILLAEALAVIMAMVMVAVTVVVVVAMNTRVLVVREKVPDREHASRREPLYDTRGRELRVGKVVKPAADGCECKVVELGARERRRARISWVGEVALYRMSF